MTPNRLRQIAADCEDPSVVASEANAAALRVLADQFERSVNHSCWVWNRQIIESIRAAVPNAPVLDEDLAEVIRKKFAERPA